MSYNQPRYFKGSRLLSEQERLQRYQILKDLSVHIPPILLLENVVNDAYKYSNNVLDDILFELNFVPQNKFANKDQLKKHYDDILIAQNLYYSTLYQLNTASGQSKPAQSNTPTASQPTGKSEQVPRHHSNPHQRHTHHEKGHHHHSHGHQHQKHEHKHKYVPKEPSNSEQEQKQKSIQSLIIYDMNHISSSNLKQIQHSLLKYALYDRNLCQVLVSQIVKKAFEYPQKAELFAELCHFICKRNVEQFTFIEGKVQLKENPFKYYLIDTVQFSFDRATQDITYSVENREQQAFLRQSKQKLISKTIFVAELILRKVLKIRVMKYCIYHLLDSFLRHYYKFTQEKKLEDSIYEYYYEVTLYFIDHLGAKFDFLSEKQPQKEVDVDLNTVKKYFEESLVGNTAPKDELYELLHHLSGEQYIELLRFVDQIFIKKQFPAQSVLLQNLLKRKNSKWEIASDKPYLQSFERKIQKDY